MDNSQRKNQKTRVATDSPKELTHSPFAKLAGQTTTQNRAPEPEPTSATPAPATPFRGRLVLRRETKHRGGKAVVVVSGFPSESAFDNAALAALASELKQTLGCGGTAEGSGDARELVLQGDRPARVAELLRAKGFKVGGVTS